MLFKAILLSFFLLPGLHAADAWTWTDTALEAASEIGIHMEYEQMQQTCGPHDYTVRGVDKCVLGVHPKHRQVEEYFIGWMIIHPVISYALPEPYRKVWMVSTIAFEAVVTSKNASVGIRVGF